MSGQYDDFSREDLILALHQSEDEIQELHQKVELAERKKAGAGADASAVMEIAELNEQVEDQQEKIDKYLADISKLKDSLTEANANMKIAQDEKVDVESKLRDATKRVDALEKDILDATNKSKTSEQQSKEASKQKSETVRETKRLYEENDHLREENKHLEEIVKQLEEHHNMIEGLLVKQSDEKDMLEVKQDQHLLAMEDLQNQMVQLEHQLDQANGKLQLSQDSENDLRGKIESLQREHKQKEDKSAENNRKLQGDISSLKKEISVLKDSTLVGEKQRELDRERHENQDNLGLIDGLHRELEAAVHERDLLSKRILDTEKNMDQLVADKVAAERQQGKITERNLQVATQRLKDEAEKIQELEDEKKSLVVEIDDLSNWKSVYEAGHGLQAHARTQKKLIDDNRRLSVALEQMTGKLGVLMDSNGLLHQAFDRLKRETGRKSSFMYPEYELQEEMQSEGARLKAELAETEEQVRT
jgi:chromosome segregation ATPase